MATEAELYKRALAELGDPDKAAAFVAKYLEGKAQTPKQEPTAAPVKAPRPSVGVKDGSAAMRHVAPATREFGPEVPTAVRFMNSPGAARMAEPREAVAYESMRAMPQTAAGQAIKSAKEQAALRLEIAKDVAASAPSAKDVLDYTVGMGWTHGTPGSDWRARQADARAREKAAREAEDARLAAKAEAGNERIRRGAAEVAAQFGVGRPEAARPAAKATAEAPNMVVADYRAKLKTVVPEEIDVDAMTDKQVIAMMASPEVSAALRE